MKVLYNREQLWRVFTILGILTCCSFLEAQDAPAIEMSGLEKPIISEEYVLMPGDSVLVTITGATNYSYLTGLTFEGKITINVPVGSMPTAQGLYIPQYDVVAAVPLFGLTLKDAKDTLRHVFNRYFRNIKVDITLTGMRRFTVYVVGEVNRPGVVFARPIDRVSVVISRAGGVTTRGSRSKIKLYRNNELQGLADLEVFERIGDLTKNPYVQDGDLIIVSQMEQSVIVRGAVFGRRGYELRVAELTATRERTSEGLYELNPGERIADIIAKAGGTTPWADPTGAYIERKNERLTVDLTQALINIESEANILLEDGDILVIPAVNAVVYVQGHVVNPGPFAYQANLKASDYIGLAGGPLSDAYLSGAFVQRGNKKLPAKKDPIVEAGDRIHVPRQIFKFWQDYVEIGAVIASLLISYLTLQSASQ